LKTSKLAGLDLETGLNRYGLTGRKIGNGGALAATAFVLALSGCAASPGATPAATPTAQDQPSANSLAESLPDRNLDSRTLYQLLIAEIEAQRGRPDAAFVIEFALAKDLRDPRVARRAAEFALMSRQQDAALASARLWAELSPQSEEANGTYLTVLVLAGQLDEAEPRLRQILTTSQQRGAMFAQVASTLSRSAEHAKALAMVQRLAHDYPELAEAHLAVAQLAVPAGDNELAVAEAEKAVALEPDAEMPTILAAQLMQGEAPAHSDQVLRNFLDRHPRSTEVRMAYARFLVGQKRYDDASAQFRSMLDQRPNDADTLFALGLLAYQAEHPRDAEGYFRHFLAVAEGSDSAVDADDVGASSHSPEQAYLYLAQIAEDRKDYSEALADLARIDEGEDYLTARVRSAMILSREGKLDQARAELHDSVARDERERNQLILAEAELLRDANRPEAALTLLDEALKKNADDPDLLYDVGMTAEKLDRLDLMESTLRKLISLHPDYSQAYNALGYTFADRNIRLAEARQLIEKALALAPDDAAIIDSLGWVQYRQGETEQALRNLQRAYALRADPEIGVHLGEVLWVTGHRDEAQKLWKEAGSKEPDNEVLRQTLARFNVDLGKH